MPDNIFAKGIYFKTPPDTAPDYVLRKVSVTVNEFIEFLQEHKNDAGYVNFDLKEAQSTHWYLQLNIHQADNSGSNQQSTGNSVGFKPFEPPPFDNKEGLFQTDSGIPDNFDDDIPF